MSVKFQLLDEPWIPVEYLDGTLKEVGLLQLIREADQIHVITHFSPVVTVSLYRLVFAIYHRAVPIRTPSEWGEVWDAGGCFDKVIDYLEKWRSRFDLLDEQAPFWQVPDMTDDHGAMSWSKLAVERNDNNNAVLFDHTVTIRDSEIGFSEAARLLIATQMISVGAGRSRTGYNTHSLIANTPVIIPEADNLRDTMISNVQYYGGEGDLPIWEQPVISVDEIISFNSEGYERPVTGISERLTWRTRAIKLKLNEEQSAVTHVHFGAGIRAQLDEGNRDPWVAYRLTQQGAWIPQRLNPQRPIWRDLDAMIVESEKDLYQAAVVMQRLRILSAEVDDREVPTSWTVLVGGQAADKAKILGWAQERWKVPDRLLQVKHLMRIPRQAINEAQEARQEIWRIVFQLIGDSAAPNRTMDRAEQTTLTNAMPVEATYWASLEPHYGRFLQMLGNQSDTVDLEALSFWREKLIKAVRESQKVAFQAVGRSAQEIRAWARVEPRFLRLQRQIREQLEGEKTA